MSTSTERLVEKFGEKGLPIGKVVMMFNVGDQTFTSRDCWNHLRDVRGNNLDARDFLVIVGARGPRMKLKGRSIGPRTEDEVESSQHCRGNATSHKPKEGSCQGGEEMNYGVRF